MAGLSADFQSLSDGMNASLPGQLMFGVPGEPGGYYTITVTQPDEKTMRLTFTPSKDTMDAIAPVDIALPEGPQGEPGEADPEQVQQLVEEYLAENPPQVTESDPTVPAWAKQPAKPSYTASEVGALSKSDLQTGIDQALAQAKESGEFDGVTPTFSIGTVKTLAAGSNATASIGGTPENPVLNLGIPQGADGEGGGGIAVSGASVGQTIVVAAVDESGVPTAWEAAELLNGVSPVEATEEMSQDVGVDKQGNLYTVPPYRGWRYIGEVVVPADTEVTSMELTADENGDPFEITEAYVVLSTSRGESSTTTNGKLSIKFYNPDLGAYNNNLTFLEVGISTYGDIELRRIAENPVIIDRTSVGGLWGNTYGACRNQQVYSGAVYGMGAYAKNLTVKQVILAVMAETETLAPGSKMKVWGR